MSLTLMYITNNPSVAMLAQKAGVDRIWVDMEYMGKEERQAGMNTVKSHHNLNDVATIREVVTDSALMVRVNPLHENSKAEIDGVIERGGEYIMLPMFKGVEDAQRFVDLVGGRAKTMLLIETAEADAAAEEIAKVAGVDEIHIGLNDLHLAYKKKFMFELLANGTVDRLSEIMQRNGKRFGFGGIARIGYGDLPAEHVITEHYRLKSEMAILSRGFCNANAVKDVAEIEEIFLKGMQDIRAFERTLPAYTAEQFEENRKLVCEKVDLIVRRLSK